MFVLVKGTSLPGEQYFLGGLLYVSLFVLEELRWSPLDKSVWYESPQLWTVIGQIIKYRMVTLLTGYIFQARVASIEILKYNFLFYLLNKAI